MTLLVRRVGQTLAPLLRGALIAGSVAGILGASAASGARLVAPSRHEIAYQMLATVEVGTPGEHFRELGPPLTIADGHGGSLTAVIGGRWPTADGYGQIIFFWHGSRFLGWNSRFETVAVYGRGLSSPRLGIIAARFAHYRPNDPLCCPRLPPVTVQYRWNGSRLIASGTPPPFPGGGRPIAVAHR